jgi:hypothetical protein
MMAVAICLAVSTATWLVVSSRPAPAQLGSSGPRKTLLFTLGQGASGVEHWDGSISVEGGSLLELEGYHFLKGDSITGNSSWKCTNRQDAVAPYADIHYTELRPGAIPAVLYHPAGIYATMQGAGAERVSVETLQGNFEFRLDEVALQPKAFLSGRALVQLVPSTWKLSAGQTEDDEPAIAALADGGFAVAWIAYWDGADRVLLRTGKKDEWAPPEEITTKRADLFRCALAAGGHGDLWAFWTARAGDQWQLWSRRKSQGKWAEPEALSANGSASFVRAAASPEGGVFVTWQSIQNGQSDIRMRAFQSGSWSPEIRISESKANDWEPAIAAGRDGNVYIAWDTYDAGNYDVAFRSWHAGDLSPVVHTRGPQFQAHAAVAIDPQGRPWVAWDESGVNWGKDQGFLIPTPLATPLHQQRSIHLATKIGEQWMEPSIQPTTAFPEALRQNAEHPQLAFDGSGALRLMFRHWTRQNDRTIGSLIDWENYFTSFNGIEWSSPVPLEHSAGSIEKNPALTVSTEGEAVAAWMTDNRPFATQVPGKADIYFARLPAPGSGASRSWALQPFVEAEPEAIPVHPREAENIRTARNYVLASNDRRYHLYRGDMHRHSDVSQDFKYDGSLLEIYRYALDAAGFDYIAITDHQAGYDQEFTWWQNQKLAHLFYAPGSFTPLFAYERSVPYPNGHRNVIFDHPGIRTLPIGNEEMRGDKNTGPILYPYLRKNDGISMPHSTATDQGTDWRDNDPDLEPLIEIYQGYRTNYEYEGAPRAATALNPQAQKSGWQPKGFYWNALEKGYRLGVQSSSDHWSTHISYAFLIADSFTRAGLLDAIRRRHSYGATDNIVLDVRARVGGSEYIMGDRFASRQAPRLSVHVIGTGAIQRIDVIKNAKFIYNVQPNTSETSFEYVENNYVPGKAWYYVRILQQDGQLAWSSPMWIDPQGQ